MTPGGLPAKATLEPREWESQLFAARANPPDPEGHHVGGPAFLAPDRVISRGAYTKPEGGPATTLIDSGTNIGLEWTQLMELYRGKGLYLLCQLPVAALYDDEPMAREMLARIVGYAAGGEPFRRPLGQFKVVSSPESPVIKALENDGIAHEVILPTAKVDASSRVLVDASALQPAVRNPDSAVVGGSAHALTEGATIVVSSAAPEDAAWLGRLSGTEVRFTSAPYLMWQGRGYRAGMDAPVAGLSQADFYYKRYAGNEGATQQATDASLTIEPFQDWTVQVVGGSEMVFPGAMVSVKVGKGTLYIDQRRWMTGHESLARVAQRDLRAGDGPGRERRADRHHP